MNRVLRWFVILYLFYTDIFYSVLTLISPPTKCYGPVPKFSKGKYYFHENGTYLLRLSAKVELELNLFERSCFQVDISDESVENGTTASKLKSLLYSVRYAGYRQSYDVRSSYEFGIAELKSDCKCDCPSGEEFCTVSYDKQPCLKGEICITRFHAFKNSKGCVHKGAATLCCQLFVKPYQNRRFTAISLVDPRPQIRVEFEIYTFFDGRWTIFRRYERTILPFRGNTLRLNGFENVADLHVRASSDSSRAQLKNGDKWYFFENKPEFTLLDDRRINGYFQRDANKFGWLRHTESGGWDVGNPKMNLHNLHHPQVLNCKSQSYVDTYDISAANVVVVRNASGKINAEPYLGSTVQEKQVFVDKVVLSRALHEGKPHMTLAVDMKPSGAPSLKLDMRLHQRMSIIAHVYASYLEDFVAQILLDKHSQRYINITLVKSYGQFNIEVFRDSARENVDLILSVITSLPFATNYTEIIPLPGFVASSRLVCIFAANKPANRLCKWTSFQKEPVDWFELRTAFIPSAGSCPGCNLERKSGFLSHLNPVNWLDGINSFSEGIAFGIEIIIYIFILLILIAAWRKCIYPLLKWALCSTTEIRSYKCVPVNVDNNLSA